MQAKADEVKPELPAGTELVVERMTPSLFPIFSVNVTGSLPPPDLRDLAVYQLRPLLSRVPGVANVAIWGERLKMLQVQAAGGHPTRHAKQTCVASGKRASRVATKRFASSTEAAGATNAKKREPSSRRAASAPRVVTR